LSSYYISSSVLVRLPDKIEYNSFSKQNIMILSQMQRAIIKYLQGRENNNYLGTIIGIKKNKININPMGILLYFDQRTGRIERFLMNSKDNINYDSVDSFNLSNDKSWYKVAEDGKLDGKFLNRFLMELFSDYFLTNKSYKICDMNYIKNYTLPMQNLNESIKEQDLSINLKGTKPFINNKYVNLNYSKPLILNVPQYLNMQAIKVTLESSYNIKLKPYVINFDSPKALIDLKVQFNARTITDIQNFNDKVIDFNKQNQDKILKLKDRNYPDEVW